MSRGGVAEANWRDGANLVASPPAIAGHAKPQAAGVVPSRQLGVCARIVAIRATVSRSLSAYPILLLVVLCFNKAVGAIDRACVSLGGFGALAVGNTQQAGAGPALICRVGLQSSNTDARRTDHGLYPCSDQRRRPPKRKGRARCFKACRRWAAACLLLAAASLAVGLTAGPTVRGQAWDSTDVPGPMAPVSLLQAPPGTPGVPTVQVPDETLPGPRPVQVTPAAAPATPAAGERPVQLRARRRNSGPAGSAVRHCSPSPGSTRDGRAVASRHHAGAHDGNPQEVQQVCRRDH